MVRRLLPKFLQEILREPKQSRRIAAAIDRPYLTDVIIPTAAQKWRSILWVGCRRYTVPYYPMIEEGGATCYTIDYDRGAKRWGMKGRHKVGSLLDVDRLYATSMFDCILCNGVFGWGVDSDDDQRSAFESMSAVLQPGGALSLGWDTHRTSDPVPRSAKWFERLDLASMSSHVDIQGSKHKYDLLIRS